MKKKNPFSSFFSPRYVMGLVFGVGIVSIFSLGAGAIFFGILLGLSIGLCLLFFGKD